VSWAIAGFRINCENWRKVRTPEGKSAG